MKLSKKIYENFTLLEWGQGSLRCWVDFTILLVVASTAVVKGNLTSLWSVDAFTGRV